MRIDRLSGAIVVLALCGWGGAILAQQRSAGQARVDFQTQIQPILAERCLECHSQDKRKGGLSLASYGDLLDGGKDGPVVRPGRAATSLLVHRVTGEIEPQMPKDDVPLGADEIALVRRWIDQGARATPTAPAAPAPWEAPLALESPPLPPVAWPAWQTPVDRIVSAYLRRRGSTAPSLVPDAQFARRAYLDAWGLLPTPEQLQAFVADRSPSKRAALVTALLADNEKYAEHWISFWNDLLRNEDGVTYFSESAGRKSITDWLLTALTTNLPYDRFVTKLVNPVEPADPEGFLVGVNWRGETSAAVTPWMQASQNTAQVFLGINLKCTSCHDSFVNRWKLKDAYGLAAYFSPDATLQMFRCDVAQEATTGPDFLFPELARTPRSNSLSDRRAAAAAIFTDRRLGRMPRTIVNRIWQRLLGHGIVATADEMDGEPWSPQLLDWLASDFVAHGYDLKRLIATVLTSRPYQMPAVARAAELPARGYAFAGPDVRRLTAEQFADAIGSITGEWSVAPARTPSPPAPRVEKGQPLPSQPTTFGVYAREWRTPSTNLTRALGRPIRDQITATRATGATTLQALELTNGAILSRWISRGARRMLGELPADPTSLYNRAVAGRSASASPFDIDISRSKRLWLIVEDTGSNVPEVILPAWAQAEFVGPSGVTPLSSLAPVDPSGLRTAPGPIAVGIPADGGVRVRNGSVLVYDIGGREFTRFRGIIGLENKPSDIGSTLNPSTRFYVFDVEPDMERLIPPSESPSARSRPARPPSNPTVSGTVDRLFAHALGRAPTQAERRIAEAALTAPGRADKPSPEGLADLLWAILMKPEFQLIY